MEDSEEIEAEDGEVAEDSEKAEAEGGEATEDSEKAETDTAGDAAPEPEADAVSEEPDDGYVSLAELKQQKTGLPTREIKQSEPQSLLDSVIDEMVPDVMNEMETSAKLKVTFAPGETEKLLEFRILDDRKAEGDEGFSLLLTNPENAQVYMVTSLAVTICDDEPAEHSEVSFTKAKYKSEDGKAVVKVKRQGRRVFRCGYDHPKR